MGVLQRKESWKYVHGRLKNKPKTDIICLQEGDTYMLLRDRLIILQMIRTKGLLGGNPATSRPAGKTQTKRGA